jgi:hypothetical protein
MGGELAFLYLPRGGELTGGEFRNKEYINPRELRGGGERNRKNRTMHDADNYLLRTPF